MGTITEKDFKQPEEMLNLNLSQEYVQKANVILKSAFLYYQKQAIIALPYSIASYIEWIKSFACQQRINELRDDFTKKSFLQSLECYEYIFLKKELKSIADELFLKLDKYKNMLLKKLPELSEKEYMAQVEKRVICFYKHHFEHIKNIQQINTKEILSELKSLRELKNRFS